MTSLSMTRSQETDTPHAIKGRPAKQLDEHIEATMRTTYDGSAALVRSLAQQYNVAESTIRAWARRLGLTQRTRPRPSSGQEHHHPWKLAVTALEEKAPVATFDVKGVTVDPVHAYLCDMGQYPRLTSAQEQLLGEQVAQGSLEARETLVLANLRLVVRIAKHYAAKATGAIGLLDLIQEGTLGLIHAAATYDVARGCRFSTHAAWWVRQAVGRACMEQGRAIRLPVGTQEQIAALHTLQHNAEEELPLNQLAAHLSLSQERVQELLIASQEIYSLDTPSLGTENDLELGSVLESSLPSPQDHAEARDLRSQLITLLHTLTPRERRIIILRYGLDGTGGRTLEQVATHFGVTRERIRQIEAHVLLELRQQAHARNLQEYLSA